MRFLISNIWKMLYEILYMIYDIWNISYFIVHISLYIYIWHLILDTWCVMHDIWHVACDTWHAKVWRVACDVWPDSVFAFVYFEQPMAQRTLLKEAQTPFKTKKQLLHACCQMSFLLPTIFDWFYRLRSTDIETPLVLPGFVLDLVLKRHKDLKSGTEFTDALPLWVAARGCLWACKQILLLPVSLGFPNLTTKQRIWWILEPSIDIGTQPGNCLLQHLG